MQKRTLLVLLMTGQLDPTRIEALAQELKKLSRGAEIVAFRRRLNQDTAAAVIRHPTISELDRAAITLAMRFADDGSLRRWQWSSGDSEIISSEDTL